MNANRRSERLTLNAFRFYRDAFALLDTAAVPFLLGGGFAFAAYTGIARHTKDLDLFVRPRDARRTLETFAAAGYKGEMIFSHWLAKVYHGDDFVDVIFSSGNGLCIVDDPWFEHAPEAEVLETTVRLIPVEEMIWQKGYIMERERFDGADVLHLLRARGRELDWDRLLARFDPHWRVLFSHLVLFGFVYPDDTVSVPKRVLLDLADRLRHDPPANGDGPVCGGPLLSRTQYLADTEEWGCADPRLAPLGRMSAKQVSRWTDAGR
jgi:hypothetical protein